MSKDRLPINPGRSDFFTNKAVQDFIAKGQQSGHIPEKPIDHDLRGQESHDIEFTLFDYECKGWQEETNSYKITLDRHARERFSNRERRQYKRTTTDMLDTILYNPKPPTITLEQALTLTDQEMRRRQVLYPLLSLGNDIQKYFAIERVVGMFDGTEAEQDAQSWRDLMCFIYTPHLVATVEGTSFIDVLTHKPESAEELIQQYTYIVNLNKLKLSGQFLTDIFAENSNNSLFSKYPITGKSAIEVLPDKFIGFSTVVADEMQQFAGSRSNALQQNAYRQTRQCIAAVDNIRSQIFTILHSPDDPRYNDVLQALNRFISEGENTTDLNALFMAGLFEPDGLRFFYREGSDWAEQEIEGMKAAIQRTIIQFLDNDIEFDYVGLSDQLAELIDTEAEEVEEEALWHAIGQVSSQIAGDQDVYYKLNEIECKKLNWSGFKTPYDARVRYHQAGGQWSIRLTFHNPLQGTAIRTTYGFYIHPDTNDFDWSLVEDPSEPDLEKMRGSSIAIAKTLLERISNQNEEIIRRLGEESAPDQPLTKQKKAHYRDPVYDLRKTHISREPSLKGHENKAEDGSLNFPQIDISDIDMHLVGLPIDVQERTRRNIDDFNKRDRLTHIGFGKLRTYKDLYRLRIGRDYRAIVQSVDEGSLRYRILSIGNRKDVYKEL